jgi:hypothetical protein
LASPLVTNYGENVSLKAKGLELLNFFYITNLSTFGSKVFLTLKIMDFKNVALTKVVHIYVIEGMNA